MGRRQRYAQIKGSLVRNVAFLVVGLVALGLFYPGIEDRPATGASTAIVSAGDLDVVDGDTVRLRGDNIRLTGYDTPETWEAECEAERVRGEAATARLRQFIDAAERIELSIEAHRDRYNRALARLTLDGQDVADLLVGEDLARFYDGGQRDGWC